MDKFYFLEKMIFNSFEGIRIFVFVDINKDEEFVEEFNRLKIFVNFLSSSFVLVLILARVGFFYIGEGDIV